MTNKPMLSERDKFEAFWRSTMSVQDMDLHRCEFPMTAYEDQPYACHETERGRMTWMARALLDEPDEPFNPQGWSIDHSAGRPILMHNKCSVIEAEQAYGLLNLIESAAQHQRGPACAQIRFRRPEKGCPDWGDWHDLKLCRFDKDRTHYVDSVGWECETRALYTEQPAPVAVVMPERENENGLENEQSEQAIGYNRALADVARLNGVNP